ncbi:IclR family transcriptional regulator [Streptomyces krungchingensis]
MALGPWRTVRFWQRGSTPESRGRDKEPAIRSHSTGPHSVDRALALLDALAKVPHPVSAKFLARRLDCALSTIYSLLAALTARGYAARTANGYTLGPEVPALYRAFQRQLALGPTERELLQQVRDAVGAEAYLSMYRSGQIAVLDSTLPLTASVDPFPVGRDLNAHATAHGKVLLASLPRESRQRYLQAHGMTRWTARTITDPEDFESEVVQVRRRGVAVSVGEVVPAFTCIAVPVPRGGPKEPARALSVSLPTDDYARGHLRVAAALTRAAATLSG